MTFQVGEWISFRTPKGRVRQCQVVTVDKKPDSVTYTVQEFPDEIYPQWHMSTGKWTVDDE